jgi:hypothetical protein
MSTVVGKYNTYWDSPLTQPKVGKWISFNFIGIRHGLKIVPDLDAIAKLALETHRKGLS